MLLAFGPVGFIRELAATLHTRGRKATVDHCASPILQGGLQRHETRHLVKEGAFARDPMRHEIRQPRLT